MRLRRRGGDLWIAVGPAGVVAVGRPGEDEAALRERHARLWPRALWRRGAAGALAARSRDELSRRLVPKPVAATVPLDLRGTAFERAVWSELRSVPFGSRITFAALAARVGAPRAVRAVGTASARCPLAPFVPTHRLVGAAGAPGLPVDDPWTPLRARLFEKEVR